MIQRPEATLGSMAALGAVVQAEPKAGCEGPESEHGLDGFPCLAASVPVVTRDIPLLAAVVEASDVGAACEPYCPDSIAPAIRWVIADADRHPTLKQPPCRVKGAQLARRAPKLPDIVDSFVRRTPPSEISQ